MCLRYGQQHALRRFSREVGPSMHLLCADCRAVEWKWSLGSEVRHSRSSQEGRPGRQRSQAGDAGGRTGRWRGPTGGESRPEELPPGGWCRVCRLEARPTRGSGGRVGRGVRWSYAGEVGVDAGGLARLRERRDPQAQVTCLTAAGKRGRRAGAVARHRRRAHSRRSPGRWP
jgi:hypothetical protein